MIPNLRNILSELDISGGALCLSFHREIFGLVQEVIGLFHDKGRNIEQGTSPIIPLCNFKVSKISKRFSS